MYSNVDFEYGAYIIIPRGTGYQIQYNTTDNKLLFNGMVLDFKDLKQTVTKKNFVIFDHALVLNKNSTHKKLEEKLLE
ncbi:hypothetical protein BH11BAC1_BH11BAC1_13490 [soil metagenome]